LEPTQKTLISGEETVLVMSKIGEAEASYSLPYGSRHGDGHSNLAKRDKAEEGRKLLWLESMKPAVQTL